MKNSVTNHFPMQNTSDVAVMLRDRRTSWYAIKPNSTGKQEEAI